MTNPTTLRVLDAARSVEDDINRLFANSRQPAWYVAQVEDAASSIAANIKEAYGRAAGRERNQFLRYSCGSAEETNERLRSGFAANRIPAKDYWRLHHRLVAIARMLESLMEHFSTRDREPPQSDLRRKPAVGPRRKSAVSSRRKPRP